MTAHTIECMRSGITACICQTPEPAKTSGCCDVVMLPPYVKTEHRELLDTAEKALADYSELLIATLKSKLDYGIGGNIQPHPSSLQEMERAYWDDPVRQELIKQVGNIKMLVERPRFLVKAT